MATFTLGQFIEGTVRFDGWDAPRGGETVYLMRDRDGLLVDREPSGPGAVRYTWPRGKRHQDASLLAVRHFERRGGTF